MEPPGRVRRAVSVGQQAYVGIGAYALFVLTDDLGVNPFLAVPWPGCVRRWPLAAHGVLVFRFRGGYFAIGTWVIAEVFRLIVANNDWLGEGPG